MFSEHLSPEAKGQVWGNAIGGMCKVWSRLQGAAAACLNEHCMHLDCLYYIGLGKNGRSGSALPGSQLIE